MRTMNIFFNLQEAALAAGLCPKVRPRTNNAAAFVYNDQCQRRERACHRVIRRIGCGPGLRHDRGGGAHAPAVLPPGCVRRSTRAVWEPPVDIFEDQFEVVIVVALPGVPADRVEVTTESGELVVRAESRLPFAGPRACVRRLEIPYGLFERRIRLPDAGLEAGTRELLDGCLILRLRKTQAEGI